MQQVAFSMPPGESMPFQYAYLQRLGEDAQARNSPRAPSGEGHMDYTNFTAYRTKLCRYHQAGYCRAGSACPFLHSPDATDQHTGVREALRHSSELQPSIRTRPSITIPPVQYPIYPRYAYTQTWSPHTGPSALPQPQPQATFQLGNPHNVGPVAYAPFDLSAYYYSNPSESPNSAADELIAPLEDLRLATEPLHHHPPYPVFTTTTNLSRYQLGPPLNSFNIDRFGYPSRASGRSHQKRSVSAPLSRKRIASYKTKPCKFWARDGNCPNGQQCTFIHDETLQNTSLNLTEVASLSSASSSQAPTELPQKPLSAIEEKKAQGFYPISWRVIGGGVMMGGNREICRAFTAGRCVKGDDCAFAHEVEYDSIGHYAPVPTEPGTISRLQVPRSLAQVHIDEPRRRIALRAPKPPSISIPSPAGFLPESGLEGTSYSAQVTAIPSLEDKRDKKSPSSHRRTRSMSTPPVSGSPVNLFSAESPGGL